MDQRKKARLYRALSAAWMAVIFLMSALPGDVSGAQSGRMTELLLAILEPVFGAVDVDMLHVLIRKAAHMAEYAVLFCLYHAALHASGAKRPGTIALVMAVVYAATDEFHQAFVADRGPSVVDVVIDGCGASIAWGVKAAVERIRRKTKALKAS